MNRLSVIVDFVRKGLRNCDIHTNKINLNSHIKLISNFDPLYVN